MWGFFLRKQAQNELEKLVTLAGGRDSEHAFSELDDALESNYGTLDEFEEDLYNLSAEEILENLGYLEE
jgi:superoxide dismutase